jgi:hypothetical protein
LIDVRAYQEIVYWKEFVRHPVPYPFDQLYPKSFRVNSSSDASMSRWGYLDSDGNSADGIFSTLLLSQTTSIMPREAFAVDKYVEFSKPNVHLISDCDNKPLVAAFKKGRRDDLVVNSILQNIYQLCYLKNIKLELYWCDTQAMIDKGTDGLSRLDYSILEDNETLNLAGIERFHQVYGKAPSCDVFASIALW